MDMDDSNGTIGDLIWKVMHFWEKDIFVMNEDERRKARDCLRKISTMRKSLIGRNVIKNCVKWFYLRFFKVIL